MKAKLMRASEWAKQNFTDDSAPTTRTILKWLREGRIEGVITEGCAFVYENSRLLGESTGGNSTPVSPAASRPAEVRNLLKRYNVPA